MSWVVIVGPSANPKAFWIAAVVSTKKEAIQYGIGAVQDEEEETNQKHYYQVVMRP